jgi:hypothetical protein
LRSARSWRPSKYSDQIRALAAEDPDFLTDLLEGATNLLELIAALDASILDDETLAEGVKTAVDKLQARKRTAVARLSEGLALPAPRFPSSNRSAASAPKASTIACHSQPAWHLSNQRPCRWWTLRLLRRSS